MKYNIVYIIDQDVMGHVDVETEPDYVYYVDNGHRHKIRMDDDQYIVVDTIEIAKKEYE